MGLEDVFKEAAERVKQLPEASSGDQLELYSLFKQSNLGDCTTDRPGGLFNMKEKAKWDAWNERKGESKDDAMRAYVHKVLRGACVNRVLCAVPFTRRRPIPWLVLPRK